MTTTEPSLDRIAVVGAGLMGHGIALSYAMSGRAVTLYDVDEDTLAAAEPNIESAVATLSEHPGRDVDAEDVLSKITFEPELPRAVEDADLVTEAVVENIDVKKEVFGRLDELTDDAILATNTSGLSITEIASAVDDPSRVVGTHWFNPPYIVPLVEVVRGEETSDAVVDATYALLESIGKTAIVVEKDIPGFIGNRIQTAMAYEAFSLLSRGVASAEDIDKAVKAGFGFRLPTLGVFEKIDQSGLDVHYEVEASLMPDLDRGTEPNPVVSDLVEKGETGIRAGKGIYDWSDTTPEEAYAERDRTLLSFLDIYESAVQETD